MLVQASKNGGAQWRTLHSIDDGTDSEMRSASFDISEYAGPNTQIRITTDDASSFDGYVYFDTLEISYDQ